MREGAGSSKILAILRQHLLAGGRLWLFLDYDGTLVPIARTPDEARPDIELLALLARLAEMTTIRVAILSGRSLSSLQAMLPFQQLILAGTYGVEISLPGNGATVRADPARVRPMIERVKSDWSKLIVGRAGFLLEDKGLAIALHARFANETDADWVLSRAKGAAEILSAGSLRILGGDRFLEVAPTTANKGGTVNWLLGREPSFGALPVYFGDDDKDEEAFTVIRGRGGIPVVVGARQDVTTALVRVSSPDAVRRWLQVLQKAALTNYRKRAFRPSWLQS